MVNRSRLNTTGSRVGLRLASDERLVSLVRRGERAAFEALYDRHSRELLAFAVYMLGSRQDAEDAVQAAYAAAYRALLTSSQPVALRPWLFTIVRNESLSILRRRRPVVELNGEVAVWGDPVKTVEVREDVRQMLDGVRRLPERQRTALVLAEVNGLSQHEIGVVLGVRPEQVKAYVYQARANLTSERRAREADCREIREELATARGAALLRGRLRRHVRACAGCREYVDSVSSQRRQLGALLPVIPTLALKYRVIEQVLGFVSADQTYAGGAVVGTTAAATAAEIAGGGFKALAVKVAAGVAALGASAGVGVSMLATPEPQQGDSSASANVASASSTGGVAGSAGSSLAGGGTVTLGGGETAARGAQPGRPGSQPGSSNRLGSHRRAAGGHEGAGTEGSGEAGGGKRGGSGGPSRALGVRGAQGRGLSARGGGEESRLNAHTESQRLGEEHKRAREASGAAERAKGAEERRRKREERSVGVSRAPRSEEELQRKREARTRKLEERQRRREEEQSGTG